MQPISSIHPDLEYPILTWIGEYHRSQYWRTYKVEVDDIPCSPFEHSSLLLKIEGS